MIRARHRFLPRRLLVASALLFSSPVAAQTILALTPSSLDRDTPDRPTQQRPNWINREDCLADDYFHFDMKVVNPTNLNFEVWIGTTTDCADYEERFNTTGRCWRVLQQLAQDNSFVVDIPVRDIADLREGQDFEANGTLETCNRQWEGQVTIYFMYVSSSGDVASSTTWTLSGVDLRGPAPPTEVEASASEEALEAKWTPSNATDLLGYRIYCAPNGGSALADAGLASDAGSSGSTGACGAEGLVAGELPGQGLMVCGEAGSKTADSAFARGLSNGAEYAIAVAATDDIGNAGPLSNVACGVPEPVESFYEHYRRVGGQGGDGICSVPAIGHPNGARSGSLLGLLAGALFLSRMRRRR